MILLAHIQQLESSFLSFFFLHEALSHTLGPALGSDTGLTWGVGHWGHIILKTKLEFFVPGYSEWFWGTRRDEDFLRTTDQVNHHKSCQIRAFETYKIFLHFGDLGLAFLKENICPHWNGISVLQVGARCGLSHFDKQFECWKTEKGLKIWNQFYFTKAMW